MKYNLRDSFFTDITLKYLLIILDQSEFIFSKTIFCQICELPVGRTPCRVWGVSEDGRNTERQG